MKSAVSLIAFAHPELIGGFIQSYRAETGSDPFFELSYEMEFSNDDQLSLLEGKVVSGHAPCPAAPYYPNLGSTRTEVLEDAMSTLESSARFLSRLGGKYLVLHAGYATDEKVSALFAERAAMLKRLAKESDGSHRDPDGGTGEAYTRTEAYQRHLETTFTNLASARDVCSTYGVTLAVENVNPRFTYLFQSYHDMIELTRRVEGVSLCVDIGHLWISSLAHEFDYHQALEAIIATGKVVTSHIHDNPSIGGPQPLYEDAHGNLHSGNVPLESSLKKIREDGQINAVLEVKSDPLRNLLLMEGMLKA